MDKTYTIFWSRFEGYTDYSGETTLVAESEKEAEEIFFRTRKEMNPYKGNFTGYVIERIEA